jgi:hypothetical protein
MLAQHPLTGKPIRVLKSSAQLWRDAKTLVRLTCDSDPSIPWARWETIAVGREDVDAVRSKGIQLHIPVFLTEPSMTLDEIEEYSRTSHLIVVTMEVIKTVGAKEFQARGLGNIICLDEFPNIYGYCGPAWNGTSDDAVAMICSVLHYSYIAGIDAAAIPNRLTRLTEMGISLLSVDAKPPQLWLIQQYFRPDKARRAREIRRCLEENVKCPFVDKLVLLNEQDYSEEFPKGSEGKILQKIVGKRLTYAMVLREIYESVPPGVIVVFSNSDIFLEESARLLWSMNLNDKFLSLLRYDVGEDGAESKIYGPRDDSQDTWILTSDSVKKRTWKWADLDFMFGKNGCDNAINVEMLRQKFLIANPAFSIKTLHVHNSGVRTYNPQDIVDKPIFLHISPTGLHDMNAKESWNPSDIFRKIEHKIFTRKIQSIQDKEIRTFCSMVKRGEEFEYGADSQNPASTPTDIVLRLKDCFLTSSGLPYGHHELYVGPADASKQLWAKQGISGCQPCIDTDLALGAVLTEAETKTPETFCLSYISKILQLRDKEGDFLCPKNQDIINVLKLFRWSRREVPVLPQDPSMGIYCKDAMVWAMTDKRQVSAEDIAALRDAFIVPWHTQVPKEKKMTIIEDGTLITSKWIAEFEEQLGDDWDVNVIWPGRTSMDRIMNVLHDTSVFVFGNGEKLQKTWAWMWMLPEGAHCIEVQNEMEPRGDAIHLAGAGGIDSWLCIVRKGLTTHMQSEGVKLALRTLRERIFGSVVVSETTPSKPVVWLPRANIKGFFGHTGDSFREMARMWGERGYCDVKEHPVATQCWFAPQGQDINEPGSWMLYDRPNLDWIYTAPDSEQSWKQGLFGNPEPPRGGKSWSFWPRRPRLVEELVAKGQTQRGYTQRSRGLVFYGKIENRVQEARRTAADWSSVCDEFVMPQGVDKPYQLSQQEYLERLCDAKYGLCLAGYGRKCHREVELMAMGCVPLVDKEVDMKNYAHPPVEGLHYIGVSGPEEVKEKLAAISEDQWTKMSQACRTWWKDNSSCEGMWNLTKSLTLPA